MDKAGIYTQILLLKASKKGTSNDKLSIELIRITGYVNIIDMLLLPLYYMWEHEYGTLEEVRFETYLMKAYTRYSLSTKNYTNQLMMILRKTSAKKELSQKTKSIVKSLLKTYSHI